ncbi:MAG: hypothetical protein ACI9WC_002854 [Arenicella sp.]
MLQTLANNMGITRLTTLALWTNVVLNSDAVDKALLSKNEFATSVPNLA